MIMLENCQSNISVYGCSPIQGTKFYSCWNFMKPGSQSETFFLSSGLGQKKYVFLVITDKNLSVWLLSNPGEKVQILVESTGQICPIVLHLFWTLSPGFENNHTFKCWSGIFPTILTYMIMLENCQNNISVYGCSPIQGTKCDSCWNLMKPGSPSGT